MRREKPSVIDFLKAIQTRCIYDEYNSQEGKCRRNGRHLGCAAIQQVSEGWQCTSFLACGHTVSVGGMAVYVIWGVRPYSKCRRDGSVRHLGCAAIQQVSGGWQCTSFGVCGHTASYNLRKSSVISMFK